MTQQNSYFLSKGSHSTASEGRCAMEWTAYLAGLDHTDKPKCVSPMLTEFCIALNDSLPDDQRQKLRPYLARTIGTAGDGRDEERRWMCADWLIRVYTPAWLAMVPSLSGHADALRAMPPVVAVENVTRAMELLTPARKDAAAARAAAGAAARDAAWAAAGAAAGDAAWAAAGDALKPTVDELQSSVFDLLDRMLPTVALELPVAGDAALVCSLP